MNRRKFLKYSASTLILPNLASTLNANEYTTVERQLFPTNFFRKPQNNKIKEKKKIEEKIVIQKKEIINHEPIKQEVVKLKTPAKIVKKENDIFLDEKYIKDFVSVRKKLKSVQSYIGHGNFNIVSFDDMIKLSNRSSKIEKFTKDELSFLEYIFYRDPVVHGFYGERISQSITQKINKKDVIKIPYTGHYLFRGEPEKVYYKMLDDIGPSLTLTSGVRSIVKQTKLFLDKIDSVNGNMAIASRSLAPPAFTYHSIADFDVGKKGFGFANFTPRFALTEEFIHMRKLKYIDMRYTINNKDGVRYEPWHVKVI